MRDRKPLVLLPASLCSDQSGGAAGGTSLDRWLLPLISMKITPAQGGRHHCGAKLRAVLCFETGAHIKLQNIEVDTEVPAPLTLTVNRFFFAVIVFDSHTRIPKGVFKLTCQFVLHIRDVFGAVCGQSNMRPLSPPLISTFFFFK